MNSHKGLQPEDDDDEGERQLSDLVAQASVASVPVRVALYVHMANVVWCLFVLLLGAIPYYHYWGAEASLVGLLVTAPVWAFAYLLTALAHANARQHTAMACGIIWTLASACFIGFISAMLFNIIALQFVAMSFGQSIALVIYLQLAAADATDVGAHGVNWRWAVPGMVVATALVWLASIYGFIVEDDWLFAVGLALLAMLLVAYNARGLSKARDYGISESDVTRAIMDHYVGDLSAIIKRLQA
jgi:hypothetical protein